MRLSLKVAMFLCMLMPTSAQAIHFTTDTGLTFETKKVAVIYGPIDSAAAIMYQRTSLDTMEQSGDRLIIINSPGGYAETGNEILAMIHAEKLAGNRIICLVAGQASSMAFNILTHCDVRFATEKSYMLVHKVRATPPCPPGYGCTAKQMRLIADDIDAFDEPYRQANAKAMHMTLADYDLFADNETIWTAKSLRSKGYLHGIATISK